jgi:hypothetical protein
LVLLGGDVLFCNPLSRVTPRNAPIRLALPVVVAHAQSVEAAAARVGVFAVERGKPAAITWDFVIAPHDALPSIFASTARAASHSFDKSPGTSGPLSSWVRPMMIGSISGAAAIKWARVCFAVSSFGGLPFCGKLFSRLVLAR